MVKNSESEIPVWKIGEAEAIEIWNCVSTPMSEMVSSGAFILGEAVESLEMKLAEYVGIPYCVSVASGTDAIVIALRALSIGPGDEVVTTPFSFFSTVEAIVSVGATPVFADISKDNYLLDVMKVEEVITSKTKAIMSVSLFGVMDNFEGLLELKDKYGIFLIEDAAQSFGAKSKSVRSCSWADVSTTSFFPSKPLGCFGDGGAIFSSILGVIEKARCLRVHGQVARYSHASFGYTSRLDALQAVILLEKLSRLETDLAKRAKIADNYLASLKDWAEFMVIPHHNESSNSAWAQFTISLKNGKRDDLAKALRQKGVATAVHYPIVIPDQVAFKTKFGAFDLSKIPNATDAASSVISLPMYPSMTGSEVQQVNNALASSATEIFHDEKGLV